MAAKKKVQRGIFTLLLVMGLYVASLQVEGFRTSVDLVCSRCFSVGMRFQQKLFSPFYKVGNYFTSISSLYERIDRLQAERDSLWEAMVQREGLATFCQDTHEIRSYAQRYEYKDPLIFAQCMIKEITPDQHTMIVDKGSRHGVNTSMVAVYKNMLLGRVSEVQNWHSKVTLLTDRRCKIAAYCVKTRAAGIVEGCNKVEEVNLSYISHLSGVQKGEAVFSSGQGLIFPRGFALGTIEHCELDGLYHKVLIKPCTDVASIDFCYLLEKGAVSGLDLDKDQES